MTDDRTPTTVAECRQAIRLHEWELLRLARELADIRRRTAEHRRSFEKGRKESARIWRRCRDRIEQIELMRDVIRSSIDGRTVDTGEAVDSVRAGLAIVERLDGMLAGTDTETEQGLRDFHRELAEVQEFAKDFFDYAGVKLVCELGELLDKAKEATPEDLRKLHWRVAELRIEARDWFV